MCWRLEYDKGLGKYKNRVTVGRLILNIIGLLVVLLVGAVAASLARCGPIWWPTLKGHDNFYKKLDLGESKIMLMDKSMLEKCTNETDAYKMLDRYVFTCGESSWGVKCIPMDMRCNGYVDCEDESDELLCDSFCPLAVKNGARFMCKVYNKNKVEEDRCVLSSYKCDGKVDCTAAPEDINDEADCATEIKVSSTGIQCADSNDFVCGDANFCVRSEVVCNGFHDCWDGSDEANCPFVPYPNKTVDTVCEI